MSFCLVTFVAGQASVKETEPLTAMKVFTDVPLEVLDMLRPSTRLDMIDYYTHADSLLTVSNALAGESRIEQVAPDYMKVSVTPVSTLEIKILPLGKKQIVMTLTTTGGEDMAKDTDVRFFDAQMNPIDASKLLKAPGLKDFFNLKDSGVSLKELGEKIPFMAVAYTTGPGDTPLTATLTTLTTLSNDDRDLLTPLLIPSLSTPWKSKFRF